jgi:hypothetical protein
VSIGKYGRSFCHGLRRWQRTLESGEYGTHAELADAGGIRGSYVCRVLWLALLAPDIVEGIPSGNPQLWRAKDKSTKIETGRREGKRMDFRDRRIWYAVAAVIIVLIIIGYATGWFSGAPAPAPQQ